MKLVTIEIVKGSDGFYMPQYRGDIQARIIRAGHVSVASFCRTHDISESAMSQIIRGRLWPGPADQKKISFGLGLSQQELLELLGVRG